MLLCLAVFRFVTWSFKFDFHKLVGVLKLCEQLMRTFSTVCICIETFQFEPSNLWEVLMLINFSNWMSFLNFLSVSIKWLG